MPPKRAAEADVPETSPDEDFIRFYRSYKRMKATARTKDNKISRLQLVLDELDAKEKLTHSKIGAVEKQRLDWMERCGEQKARADELEAQLGTVKGETQPDEQKRRDELEIEAAGLRGKDRRAELVKAALQELFDMEAEHKKLLEKFNNYKKRICDMSNEQ